MLWVKFPEEAGAAQSTLALLAKHGIVTEPVEAAYRTTDYTNGAQKMWMKLPESGRRIEFFVPADDSMLAWLAANKIAYSTAVEGRDYDQLGLPFKLLGFLSFFCFPMGAVTVLRRPWRFGFKSEEVEIRRDERNAIRAFKALAVCVALVLLAAGVMLGLVIRWHARTLSAAEAQKMAADLKDAHFEVYQYNNGTKELWIIRQTHPDFIAPADEATLATLAEKGIGYRTFVQGRDFGYGVPGKGVAAVLIILLVGGALIILWRVSPKTIAALAALVMIALAIALGAITLAHEADFDGSSANDDPRTPGRPVGDFRIQQRFPGDLDYSDREQPLSPLRRHGRRLHARPAGRQSDYFQNPDSRPGLRIRLAVAKDCAALYHWFDRGRDRRLMVCVGKEGASPDGGHPQLSRRLHRSRKF